jgi:hypothetical protein
MLQMCCDWHRPLACCDPNDCGPCCERCPSCLTLMKGRRELEAPRGSTYRYLDAMLQTVWWTSTPTSDDHALSMLLHPSFPWVHVCYVQRQYFVPGDSQPKFVTLPFMKRDDELVMI